MYRRVGKLLTPFRRIQKSISAPGGKTIRTNWRPLIELHGSENDEKKPRALESGFSFGLAKDLTYYVEEECPESMQALILRTRGVCSHSRYRPFTPTRLR